MEKKRWTLVHGYALLWSPKSIRGESYKFHLNLADKERKTRDSDLIVIKIKINK